MTSVCKEIASHLTIRRIYAKNDDTPSWCSYGKAPHTVISSVRLNACIMECRAQILRRTPCRRGVTVCHTHPDCRPSLIIALSCATNSVNVMTETWIPDPYPNHLVLASISTALR